MIRARLEENAEDIVEALITRACAGSTDALALAMDRLCPPLKIAQRPPFDIGSLDRMSDCIVAQRKLVIATATGEIDDDAAISIQRQIEGFAKLLTQGELVERLERLEARMKADDRRPAAY